MSGVVVSSLSENPCWESLLALLAVWSEFISLLEMGFNSLALQGICFHTFIGCAENQAFLRLFWYLLLGKINHDIYMLIGFD